MPEVRRRDVLKAASAGAAVTLLGFRIAPARAAEAPVGDAVFAPNAYIRLGPDGVFTLVMPNQEMGQGIHTGHAQLLAEELDIPLSMVRLVHAPADDALYGGPRRRQSTGGSSSMRGGLYMQLRQAGADARAMLLEAAAARLEVPMRGLEVKDGVVTDRASQKSVAYRDIAAAAAAVRLKVPGGLKSPDGFKLIGTEARRLDMPAKVNGSAVYGIDAFAGEIRVAAVMQAPTLGGKVASVTPQVIAPEQVPGVERVIVLDDLVAVVAQNTWAAFEGLNALTIGWTPGPAGSLDQAKVREMLRADGGKTGAEAIKEGGAKFDPGKESWDISAEYELPFLAHAPMEPLNCTVHVRGGSCELWLGTQVQTSAQAEAAKVLGIDPAQVTLNNHMLGGAFGRRLDVDMVNVAVRVGREVGLPVKVMWSREADMRHDVYRPHYHNRLGATLKDGVVDKWFHRISAGSVIRRTSGKPLKDGLDGDAVEAAAETPYSFAQPRVEYVNSEPNVVNFGWWRGVGPNNAIFAIESFIEELAAKAGRDPIEFRLAMLGETPRLAECLRQVREKSGWDDGLPRGQGRGVSAFHAFGSYVATVCEVEVSDAGAVRARRFTTVVDCGTAINPNLIRAQFEGGINFGLSAALHEKITVADGQVVQGNFNDYRILRHHEAPRIDVHIVTSSEPPGGVGEPPVTAVAPALCNAIARATGIRVRSLPISDHDLTRSNWR